MTDTRDTPEALADWERDMILDDLADQPDTARKLAAILATAPDLRDALTHGRHCPCSACARQDWTAPDLAPCGRHGKSCPPFYAPAPDALEVERHATGAIVPEELIPEPRRSIRREQAATRDTPQAALDVMADALDHSMGPERRRRLAADVLASMSPDWELRRREPAGPMTIHNTPETTSVSSPALTLADLRPFLGHPRSCAFERYKYEANEDSGPQPPCDCGLAAILACASQPVGKSLTFVP